jgi:Arv1-like family
MLLHKPQVYRHLLFNRITYTDEKSIEVRDVVALLTVGVI